MTQDTLNATTTQDGQDTPATDSLPLIHALDFARNSNIFAIAGAVGAAYRREGRIDEYHRNSPKIMTSGLAYDELVKRFAAMVQIVGIGEMDDDWDDLDAEPEF